MAALPRRRRLEGSELKKVPGAILAEDERGYMIVLYPLFNSHELENDCPGLLSYEALAFWRAIIHTHSEFMWVTIRNRHFKVWLQRT